MKVLLTGSEGFVGQYVVRRLLALGHEVHGVDSMEEQVHGPLKLPLKRNYALHLVRAGEVVVAGSYDAIIHLAAAVGVGQSMYDPAGYVDRNSLDTAKLLVQLSRHRPARLVVASSMSVYGEGAVTKAGPMESDSYICDIDCVGGIPLPTPETKPPDLRSIYALTKYDQEQLSLIWGRAHGVPTVALRFFNTYGPGQALQNPYTGALAIFATRLLNGKAPVLYEDGQQTRDFIYVEDVAEAVVRAATTPVEAGVYNVGTGIPTTIEDVAKTLSGLLDLPILPEVTGKHRAGDIRHCYANNAKLRDTGWNWKTGFVTGLARYVEWLRTQPVPVDRFEEAAKELEAAGLVR